MAVFEMPLDQLQTYRGASPCPPDFDAYWEAGRAEMHSLGTLVELRPNSALATRAAECFDLWFTGVGGAKVYAKYLRPRHRRGRCPAILRFHGYTANSGDWSEKLGWVGEGFCVAALDCRGQGGRSEDSGNVRGNTMRGQIIRGLDDPDPRRLLFRAHFLDTAQMARVVMGFPEIDPDRVAAFGLSQGGGARACLRSVRAAHTPGGSSLPIPL